MGGKSERRMRSFVLGACLVFLAFVSLAVFTQEDESGHNPDSAHYATFENTEASPESDEDAVLDAAPTATELLRSASYSQNGDIAEAELNQGITADEAATLKNSASHASEYSETPLTAQVKTTRSEREKPCVGLCAIQAAHDSDMLREEIMTTHHAMDAFVQGSATPAAAASAAKPAAAGAKPPTGAKASKKSRGTTLGGHTVAVIDEDKFPKYTFSKTLLGNVRPVQPLGTRSLWSTPSTTPSEESSD